MSSDIVFFTTLVIFVVLLIGLTSFPYFYECPRSSQGTVINLINSSGLLELRSHVDGSISEALGDLKGDAKSFSDLLNNLHVKEGELSSSHSKIANFVEKLASSKNEQFTSLARASNVSFSSKPSPFKCDRIQDGQRNSSLEWKPRKGKYLLVVCTAGQLTNRILCIKQNMLDAALLRRILIFPSVGIDYDYRVLLDLSQPTACFGKGTFMTLEEYMKKQAKGKKWLKVNRFICPVRTYQTEKICGYITKRYTPLNVTFEKVEIPPLRPVSPWRRYNTRDFLGNFSYSDRVIAFGNMFGMGGGDLPTQGTGPIRISQSCRYFLNPSPAILGTAQGYVDSYLGSNFMAVHLRRGDFFQHCKMKDELGKPKACFHPIQQLANCLAKKLVENPEVRVIFLATNGEPEEVKTLKDYLHLVGRPVPVVRLPSMEGAPWAESVRASGLESDPLMISYVEKVICGMSSVFYGTVGSTFSTDILKLRDWWRFRSCSDGLLCQGESPDLVVSLK